LHQTWHAYSLRPGREYRGVKTLEKCYITYMLPICIQFYFRLRKLIHTLHFNSLYNRCIDTRYLQHSLLRNRIEQVRHEPDIYIYIYIYICMYVCMYVYKILIPRRHEATHCATRPDNYPQGCFKYNHYCIKKRHQMVTNKNDIYEHHLLQSISIYFNQIILDQ
jgi:hypothetical protein